MTRDELVEKMVDSFDEHHGEDRKDMRRRMSAALDVAKEEFCFQLEKAFILCGHSYAHNYTERILEHIFEAKVKTPEERVVIQQVIGDGPSGEERWYVFCDGALSFDFPNQAQRSAEIYRLGLIAKLKEESK